MNRLILHESEGQIRIAWQPDGLLVPTHGAAVAFTPALTPTDRDDLRWYLETYLKGPYGVYADRGRDIRARLDDLGHALFESVFGRDRPGRDAYVKAIEGRPERCELIVQSSAPAVLAQPWELLKDPDRPEPLALTFAGLSRGLPIGATPFTVPPAERLRVLLVIARPSGEGDVSHQIVARPLLRRLPAVSGKVEITVLRPPTFSLLRETLAAANEDGQPFHIVHFDGHGNFGVKTATVGQHTFDTTAGPQGYLLFETPTGDDEAVAASDFAAALAKCKVPVVVLNACRSGHQDDAVGPEATVATRLLQHGVAAVVAMSHSVYAVAAAEFMAVFYQSLFDGRTLAQAVGEGRAQLRRADARPSPKGPLPLADWMVPVLYAHRSVAFPGLKTEKQRGIPPLSQVLDKMRAVAVPEPRDGIHDPASLDGVGPFFGRDIDFLRLERWMLHRPVVVVRAPGGSGKTELAKAFARWWRDTGGLARPDLVFFHSFEPGIASFGLDGVVNSIGFHVFGADFAHRSSAEREAALLEVMGEHRMLLVWDNFESVFSQPDPNSATPPLGQAERERIRAFLTRVLEARSSAVIITSRSPEDWLGDGPAPLVIGGLDPENAGRYADHLLAGVAAAPARRAEPAFAELMRDLDGHPLSMRLLLPRLADHDAATLRQALHGETTLPGLFERTGRHLDSLGACIHVSFRHLAEPHRRLLPAVALFEGVADADVLMIFSKLPGVPERFKDVSREDWGSCLDAAAGFGLLTGLGVGTWRIHPALPPYLLEEWRTAAECAFDEELSAARATLTTACAHFGAWLYRQIEGGDAGLAFGLIALQRRTLGTSLDFALRHDDRYDEAQAILQPLNEYWNSRGLTAEADGWSVRCRARLEAADGTPPPLDTPAGELWLFVVGAGGARSLLAGDLSSDSLAVPQRLT